MVINKVSKVFKTENLKWLLSITLFLVITGTILLGLFDRAEMKLYDSWFRLRGVVNPGDKVVIIAIDDASIQKEGRLPWPRSKFAELLPRLKDAKVVGFDLIFDVPSKPEEDQALAKAVAEHGKIVFASSFTFEEDSGGELLQVFNGPLPDFHEGMVGTGFINIPTYPDGVIRDFFPIDKNFEGALPSFGLMLGLAAVGAEPSEVELDGNQLSVAGRKMPLDKDNKVLIEFWGPKGTFKTYSFSDVVNGKVPEGKFKDKVVLIGPTAVLAKDNFPTPYTTSNLVMSGNLPTPGVEIHAAAINSFLENQWYSKASTGANFGFLLVIGLLTTVAVSGRGPWWGLVGVSAVTLTTAGLVWALWYYQRLWLDLAAPLALIFLSYSVMNAVEFINAELARRRTRALFSRYVSPAVVEELMQDPDKVALGGRRQWVTVMFCDIRGFTSYSENKNPEEVVKRLNEYLTIMTKVIFKHGGTLDKYLGDGLMAIFGAPIFYSDHVQRSLKAAAEIQKEIAQLNNKWMAQEEPPLQIGVGINSGNVLVGNVGSSERMDYTVIGEDVNLASRVESLTKEFKTPVVIMNGPFKFLETRSMILN